MRHRPSQQQKTWCHHKEMNPERVSTSATLDLLGTVTQPQVLEGALNQPSVHFFPIFLTRDLKENVEEAKRSTRMPAIQDVGGIFWCWGCLRL